MSKVAVVYWSGTGNTEMMAQKVAEGAKALNNYPFSLRIYRMLSSSNGDDDIISSCRQRFPALSLRHCPLYSSMGPLPYGIS